MTSTRESALSALATVLAAAIPTAEIERNAALPETIAAGGRVVIFDGDPGEPERTLGAQPAWYYEHRAELELFVPAGTGQDAALDALLVAIGAALAGNPTLGGAVQWAEPEAPTVDLLPPDGGGRPLKAAAVKVMLAYSTASPL
ncbi:hypothetical protein ABB55_27810 [Prosthecomicrobium hirschii]|uniref:Acyl-CoA transferase n=1 Tax=Prosthecodimorpha hirschii TaxID=665126 RepID=A0A0P6VS73_9HYPH|nr:hypothetical protein [Prosthecomicrobium hirschii]KPL55573.1 hypothetical protein ABB55_27810 [Prosthecomicrobium hirschii]